MNGYRYLSKIRTFDDDTPALKRFAKVKPLHRKSTKPLNSEKHEPLANLYPNLVKRRKLN